MGHVIAPKIATWEKESSSIDNRQRNAKILEKKLD